MSHRNLPDTTFGAAYEHAGATRRQANVPTDLLLGHHQMRSRSCYVESFYSALSLSRIPGHE